MLATLNGVIGFATKFCSSFLVNMATIEGINIYMWPRNSMGLIPL